MPNNCLFIPLRVVFRGAAVFGLISTAAAASVRSAAAASELESGREGFEFDISNQGGGEVGGAGGAIKV